MTRDKADEVLPGVFSVQLFPPQFATKLWEEFHHYESFAKDHPELNLPLHFRHDNNFGSLQGGFVAGSSQIIKKLTVPSFRLRIPPLSERSRRRCCATLVRAVRLCQSHHMTGTIACSLRRWLLMML